ncbi:hypothetical protein CEJ46_18995 [Vibrio anguillarum]|nr:hypothetical protein CEJ46_18995 [Vibrio anguillarum]
MFISFLFLCCRAHQQVSPYFVIYNQRKPNLTHPPTPYALDIMDYFRDHHRSRLENSITKKYLFVTCFHLTAINYLNWI